MHTSITKVLSRRSFTLGALALALAPKAHASVTVGGAAYALGRKWGMACTLALLGSQRESAARVRDSEPLAAALGIKLPAAPAKENALETMRDSELRKALKEKHGLAVALIYWCGMRVSDAFFGAALKADITEQLSDIELVAKKLKVPESVFADALTATRAAGQGKQEAPFKALSKALDAHFEAQG